MEIFALLVIVLIAWFLIKTFSVPILIVVTIVMALIWLACAKDIKGRGLDGVPHLLYMVMTPIFLIAIWVMWYNQSEFTFVSEFMNQYIWAKK